MISPKQTKTTRDVFLLEEVNVTHISLVDKPANRVAFKAVKRALDPIDNMLDNERKAWNTLDELSKVATPKETNPITGVQRKGRWVTNSAGRRFFIEERKPRTRDASGATQLPRQFKKLPDKTVKRPA